MGSYTLMTRLHSTAQVDLRETGDLGTSTDPQSKPDPGSSEMLHQNEDSERRQPSERMGGDQDEDDNESMIGLGEGR